MNKELMCRGILGVYLFEDVITLNKFKEEVVEGISKLNNKGLYYKKDINPLVLPVENKYKDYLLKGDLKELISYIN